MKKTFSKLAVVGASIFVMSQASSQYAPQVTTTNITYAVCGGATYNNVPSAGTYKAEFIFHSGQIWYALVTKSSDGGITAGAGTFLLGVRARDDSTINFSNNVTNVPGFQIDMRLKTCTIPYGQASLKFNLIAAHTTP